jgi:predicted Zn-dependent protease
MEPDNLDWRGALGGALAEAGRLDDALACFERGLGVNTSWKEGRVGKAKVLLQIGKGREAIEILKEVTQSPGATLGDQLDLAKAYALVNDNTAALAVIRAVLARSPANAEALTLLKHLEGR